MRARNSSTEAKRLGQGVFCTPVSFYVLRESSVVNWEGTEGLERAPPWDGGGLGEVLADSSRVRVVWARGSAESACLTRRGVSAQSEDHSLPGGICCILSGMPRLYLARLPQDFRRFLYKFATGK